MTSQIVSHTALRGLAALAVCWGHYTNVFARDVAGLDFYLPHTHLGVDLFFLLSGFVMVHVYGAWFAPGISPAGWARYMVRRLLRLYPLHLATLLAVILLMRLEVPDDQLGILLQNLTLTHAWGFSDQFLFNAPSWSISAEFAAYLLFPLLAFCLTAAWARVMLLGMAGAAAAWLWQLGAGSLDLDAIGRAHVLGRVALGFPLGMLLGWAVQTGYGPGARAGRWQMLALAGLVGVFALRWPEIMAIGPFAVLIWATAEDHGWLAKTLANPVLRGVGTVSYGIYMLQWPVMMALFYLQPKLAPYLSGIAMDLALVGVFLALLFGLAAASWHWLERPMLRMAR